MARRSKHTEMTTAFRNIDRYFTNTMGLLKIKKKRKKEKEVFIKFHHEANQIVFDKNIFILTG